METIFGRCKINSNGYYQVTSSKEGNLGKYLHRLIFERFYGFEIPKGFVIHHKNENRADNCILNLQLMRRNEHSIHHNKGEAFSDEEKIKRCKHNQTGYFRVWKKNQSDVVQGFTYQYVYYENGKRRYLSSVNLDKLKEKVLAKGLLWLELDNQEVTC